MDETSETGFPWTTGKSLPFETGHNVSPEQAGCAPWKPQTKPTLQSSKTFPFFIQKWDLLPLLHPAQWHRDLCLRGLLMPQTLS